MKASNGTLNQPENAKDLNVESKQIAVQIKEPGLKKSIFILIVAVAFLGVGIVSWFLYPKDNAGPACSDETITQAADYINNNKLPELRDLSDKIVTTKDYDKDVNCLYIVTTRYIEVGDAENSRKYYDLLASIYDSEAGYSKLFGDTTNDPDQIRQTVEFFEQKASKPTEGVIFGDQE